MARTALAQVGEKGTREPTRPPKGTTTSAIKKKKKKPPSGQNLGSGKKNGVCPTGDRRDTIHKEIGT